MKKNYSVHRFIRIISLVSLPMLAAVEFGDRSLLCGAVAAMTVILLYPQSYERPFPSLCWALGAVPVLLLSDLLLRDDLYILVGELILFAYLSYRSLNRFRRPRQLFSGRAPWYQVEDYSRFYMVLAWMICAQLLALLAQPGWRSWLAGVLACGCYALMMVRARSGRLAFLRRDVARSLELMVRGNLRTVPPDGSSDSARQLALYNKAVRYLQEKKPFLDEDFTLADLAGSVFSNKVYLSRAINDCSGRNFKQFLNYHRVLYAKSLMDRDPRLRVFEVASMSGFHNPVTFSVAFKVNLLETPGDYLQRLRSQMLEAPSSSEEAAPKGPPHTDGPDG